MNTLCRRLLSVVARSSSKTYLIALLLAGTSLVSSKAVAEDFWFSFSGGGMSGSGMLTTSDAAIPGIPGGQQIVGITGTFTDTVANITGAITGLQTTSLPTAINPDGTFVPPGTAADGYGFSYDNIFYPAGNSPAVCPPPGPGDPEAPYPFGGGMLDIYGVLFNVEGGYSVDVWSNGVLPGLGLTYGVGDSKNGTAIDKFGEPFAPSASFTAQTPEPSSLLLLGTGMAGALFAFRRKMRPATI